MLFPLPCNSSPPSGLPPKFWKICEFQNKLQGNHGNGISEAVNLCWALKNSEDMLGLGGFYNSLYSSVISKQQEPGLTLQTANIRK